jgi:hypothetical protein
MKPCVALSLALFLSSCLTGFSAAADSNAAAQLTELPVVVVDVLKHHQGAITDFDRIDMAFQKVAKQRNWPVKIAAERFASNTPVRDTEFRIFNQPLREETTGDLTFRGWMTLMVNGTKHDFGVVTYRYYRRAGEHTDDVLEKVFLGVVTAAADRIEPILFPQLSRK